MDLLAPQHTSDVHTIMAGLLKSIIAMATPSPAASMTEGLQNGPASNRFARELAQRESVSKLMTYISYDFGPGHNVPAEDTEDLETSSSLLTLETAKLSVAQSICIIIELNNSNYCEPFIFHPVRNRLIQIQ